MTFRSNFEESVRRRKKKKKKKEKCAVIELLSGAKNGSLSTIYLVRFTLT